MNKKGDISIGLIITAAIALIVLVVIVAIFAGYFTGFQKKVTPEEQSQLIKQCETTSTVEGLGGTWRDACLDKENRVYLVSDAASNPGKQCCVGTG